ncbi:transcriptional regulator [Hymenobacter coccineus]|uniref:Transcriptional regulator n=1 Tax=Hymenobacter coccineus TaxID=1908235 RepID=A0A1G1TG10_9BACT|nr:transcriptional regulator [Hymenobacter coccineus]
MSTSNTYTIPQFLDYLGVRGAKDDALHVIRYDEQSLRVQSPPVSIYFYSLSLKEYVNGPSQMMDLTEPYIYLDTPHKTLEWDNCDASPGSFLSGYGLLVSAELLEPYVKQYSFATYSSHEALYLLPEEKTLLQDLFEKAYAEYQKEPFTKPIVVSYAALLLSYIQLFYERQFQSRATLYHRVVADFYAHLEQYFTPENDLNALPTVAYFAEKAALSTNYFGDLIKSFTGQPPQTHIQQHVVQLAKTRLRHSDATVSEIAYALGFEYPTYFTRFFKKETGITPTVFRQQ